LAFSPQMVRQHEWVRQRTDAVEMAM